MATYLDKSAHHVCFHFCFIYLADPTGVSSFAQGPNGGITLPAMGFDTTTFDNRYRVLTNIATDCSHTTDSEPPYKCIYSHITANYCECLTISALLTHLDSTTLIDCNA